jgi:hypothetical protein
MEMKRCCAFLFVLAMLGALLVACTGKTDETPKNTPTPTVADIPTPVITTPPDMEYFNFVGNWIVSAVTDSNGNALSAEQLSQMNADITLELSKDGTYFIYDKNGAPLGQGRYRVNQDKMVLSAGGLETIYTIMDADTLQCTAEDGSITIMSRSVADEDI